MPEAESLRDLLLVREANRASIEAINGNLGSALGRKKSRDANHPDNGKPAILIFVPEKVAAKWLPPGQEIPKVMHGPEGLVCPVDVVQGGKLDDFFVVTLTPPDQQGVKPWSSLRDVPPLSPGHLALIDDLRGWSQRITPGSQLAGVNQNGRGYFGTLGFFAVDTTSGEQGLVTNFHVADHVGNVLHYASLNARPLALAERAVEFVTDEARFDGLIDEPNARYRVDCAFARLSAVIGGDDIDPRIPLLSENGEKRLVKMGLPLPLDINTMGPIGQPVIGVGRTRSFQSGTIVAFAYEHMDAEADARYTDYLIIGDAPDEFSDPGDSGKLILTDEPTPRPVALLWGGWYERLRTSREQENWTYAIDINYVLELLRVEFLR